MSDPIHIQLTITALVVAILAAARTRVERDDLYTASIWVLGVYTAAPCLGLSWLVVLGFYGWWWLVR